MPARITAARSDLVAGHAAHPGKKTRSGGGILTQSQTETHRGIPKLTTEVTTGVTTESLGTKVIGPAETERTPENDGGARKSKHKPLKMPS